MQSKNTSEGLSITIPVDREEPQLLHPRFKYESVGLALMWVPQAQA